MAATNEDLRQNVDPGSMPYGMRQAFEASLGNLGAGANPATALPAGDEELGIPSNPLDPLLSGDIPTGSSPLTSGLSVGPGPGAMDLGLAPIVDSRVDRLRIMAMNAASPVLRQMARRALRGVVKEYRNA